MEFVKKFLGPRSIMLVVIIFFGLTGFLGYRGQLDKDLPVQSDVKQVAVQVPADFKEMMRNMRTPIKRSNERKVIPKPKIEPQSEIKPEQQNKSESEKFFFVAYDEPPEPIGGFEAIQKNLVYPESAAKAGIEGNVTVRVMIDENGDVVDSQILVPMRNSECNEAAVAVLKSLKWKPAKKEKKAVTVWVAVPVKFKLK